MQKLTKRQQQILDMIRAHIDETGVPPTRADICDYFDFRSPTAADDHLKALARKEVIELMPGTSRLFSLRHVLKVDQGQHAEYLQSKCLRSALGVNHNISHR